MSIFQLSDELVFPDPELADREGLLALGGDLSSERLLLAYRSGIFPWFSDGMPIMWWSPDPRCVLYPEELHISKSMKKIIASSVFKVTYDSAFEQVIEQCRKIPRRSQDSTWITREMANSYCDLYRLGFAHSVEVWREGNLVGGLYGVALGACFFGESMFSVESNASKAGFIELVNNLKRTGTSLIDCQVYTEHLVSLGAREIDRTAFLQILNKEVRRTDVQSFWLDISTG